MIYYRIVLYLSFLFISTISTAQNCYNIVHFGIRQGLSNNQINCLYQDQLSYVWIGTQNGLNRYDGNQFLTFKQEKNNPYALWDDAIYDLWGGPNNSLWVRTPKGIQVFFLKKDCLFFSADSILRPKKLSSDGLIKIKKGANVFYFVYADKIVLFSDQLDRLGEVRLNNGHTFNDIAWVSKDHTLLIVDNAGSLYQYQQNKLASVLSAYFPLANKDLNFSIFVDTRKCIWLYRRGENFLIHRLEPNAKTWQPFWSPEEENLISDIQQKDSTIWISKDHNGVALFDIRSGTVQRNLTSCNTDFPIDKNSFVHMLVAHDGQIWLGSFKNGAGLIVNNHTYLPWHNGTVNSDPGLKTIDVNCFIEDKKHNLFIGTNGSGLAERKSAGEYQYYTKENSGLPSNTVVSFAKDENDRLWVGTYLGGIAVLNDKGFITYKNNPSDPHTLADNRIFALHKDLLHQMWVGTISGGIDRYDTHLQQFVHYKDVVQKTLNTTYVSCIAEDSSGYLWVGTDKGILLHNSFTKKWIALNPDKYHMEYKDIMNMYCDPEGDMWCATRQGLMVLKKGAAYFLNYTREDGLPDNLILNVLSDKNNNIWLSTLNNIAKIDYLYWKKTGLLSIRKFGIEDNIQEGVFNRYSAAILGDGSILFGGTKGFNWIDPSKIDNIQQLGEIRITKILIKDKKGNFTMKDVLGL